MDQTKAYFNKEQLKQMREQLKTYQTLMSKLADEDKKCFYETAYEKEKEALEELLFTGMDRAYNKDGYNLTRQDISEILDISEEQVRRYIVPFVDHIKPPEGAGAFFSLHRNPDYPLIENRINKWKKVFINREAFYTFLQEKLFLHCPYSKLRWMEDTPLRECVESGQETHVVALEKNVIKQIVAKEMLLKRKANIAEVIAEQKKEGLFRKTRNEINQALKDYHDGLNDCFDVERHNQEMIYARKVVDEMKMTVYNAEIEQALKSPKNRGKFYKFELWGHDIKIKEEKRIAVLYWLEKDFVYASKK